MKQLREDFSSVKEKLEKGEELMLIYRSQPLAKITSLMEEPFGKKAKTKKKAKKKDYSKIIEKLAGGFELGDWTPEQLNKLLDKRYEKMLSGF